MQNKKPYRKLALDDGGVSGLTSHGHYWFVAVRANPWDAKGLLWCTNNMIQSWRASSHRNFWIDEEKHPSIVHMSIRLRVLLRHQQQMAVWGDPGGMLEDLRGIFGLVQRASLPNECWQTGGLQPQPWGGMSEKKTTSASKVAMSRCWQPEKGCRGGGGGGAGCPAATGAPDWFSTTKPIWRTNLLRCECWKSQSSNSHHPVADPWCINHHYHHCPLREGGICSGQFITTSAEVTRNGGLVNFSKGIPPKMALN